MLQLPSRKIPTLLGAAFPGPGRGFPPMARPWHLEVLRLRQALGQIAKALELAEAALIYVYIYMACIYIYISLSLWHIYIYMAHIYIWHIYMAYIYIYVYGTHIHIYVYMVYICIDRYVYLEAKGTWGPYKAISRDCVIL